MASATPPKNRNSSSRTVYRMLVSVRKTIVLLGCYEAIVIDLTDRPNKLPCAGLGNEISYPLVNYKWPFSIAFCMFTSCYRIFSLGQWPASDLTDRPRHQIAVGLGNYPAC